MSAIDGATFGVKFFGVRGSTPCDGDELARYGGNTSCVAVDVPGAQPIMFDLGTGARYYGQTVDPSVAFDGVCLLSHLHWDHVQGLPFFPPALRPGSRLTMHGPIQTDGRTVGEVIDSMLCPPLFPIGLADLPGAFDFGTHSDDDFMIGDVEVMARLIPHLGPTLGYRLTWQGMSVAYLSDHHQPGIDVYEASENAMELCRGVDLLIHDAQYTVEEFETKASWGHCTVDYAAWLAREAGVGTLALFHHDPTHDDDQLDELVEHARRLVAGSGVKVIGASEGLYVPIRR